MTEPNTSARPFPRTLYVSHWFPLSSETFVFHEVDAFFKRHAPVSVISLYGKKEKNLSQEIRETNIPIERFGILNTGRILRAVWRKFRKDPAKTKYILRTLLWRRWRDVEMRLENAWAALSGFYLAERCKELEIEHIHSAWANGPATAAWVAYKLENIPFSFTARAHDVRPPDGFLQEKLEGCAFARADSLFNMPYMEAFLPEEKQYKLHLVYNVTTLPTLGQALVPMQAPYKLIAIGNLIETKGFHYLIDAVQLLVKDGIEVELSIAGTGPWMKKLTARIAQYGIGAHVHMLGFVQPNILSRKIMESDILVMPSVIKRSVDRSDGLPTVVIEAMCHGLPVVATDVASMGDVVKNGKTGYLVPERDAKALAVAIFTMLDDRAKALQMAKNAKELVSKMFDSETNIQHMSELFCKYTPVQKN